MSRSTTAIAAGIASLGLVVSMAAPAHAASRARVDEARGDVRSNDDTAVSRAEKNIDLLGQVTLKTVADGRRDLLVMKANGKDFRGSGQQWLYLFPRGADGGRSIVLANLDGSAARVFADGSEDRSSRCRGGGVRANLRRDTAVLRMPARCLGGGDAVTVEDAGSVFARSASIEAVTAFDSFEHESVTLDYR